MSDSQYMSPKRRTPTHRQTVSRLIVPFHHQSFDFTCGPSCLIMAMRAFDPSLPETRDLEIDLWREANMVEAYASSRQGLALAAFRRGFRVRSQGNVEGIELLDCLGLHLTAENRQVARALHEDLKERCRAAGIPDRTAAVSLDSITDWIAAGACPLVLVDARLVMEETVPHWIVPTSTGKSEVRFHDPLASSGSSVVSASRFERRLGFRGTTCAVVVDGKVP